MPTEIAIWVAVITTAGGLIGTIVQHRRHPSETRREQAADWAGYTQELRGLLAEERADAEKKDLRLDALGARIDTLDTAVRLRDAHVLTLEAHIRQQLPPPPPARPY